LTTAGHTLLDEVEPLLEALDRSHTAAHRLLRSPSRD
jgi:hypothetical protein